MSEKLGKEITIAKERYELFTGSLKGYSPADFMEDVHRSMLFALELELLIEENKNT